MYRIRVHESWSMKDNIVALKNVDNSQNIVVTDFLREIANYRLLNSKDKKGKMTEYGVVSEEKSITKIFGISQDPETKNYLIVMEYKSEGSQRKFLNRYCKDKDISRSIATFGLY